MKTPDSRTARNRTRSRPHLSIEQLEPRVLLSAAVSNLHPLAAIPGDSQYGSQWHLPKIKAPDAWDLTTGNNNVVIAVFDTGLDLNHPDLMDNVWRNSSETANNGIDDDNNGFVDDVFGWNFVDGNSNVQDTSTTMHGTTVAGVLGAVGNNALGISGVNWNIDMMVMKIGTDAGVSSQNLINAINYVNMMKQRGVNIVAINASYLSFSNPSITEFNAIRTAGDNGMLYISAAGNSSFNYDNIPFFNTVIPSNMMLIAATDNQDRLASFSAYGKKTVTLAAPGVDILTTIRGGLYFTVSGTSYAGPIVSGIVGLMKSLMPSATMAQMKSALISGSDAVASLSSKVVSGGRVNAYKSLELLLGQQTPFGSVDVLNNTTISGWSFDFNAGAKATSVQIYIDGTLHTTLPANTARPDLASAFGSANHGFSFAIPNTLAGGAHTVQVYAVDFAPFGASLAPQLIGQGTISVASPPIGNIEVAGPTQVIGWAIDRDTPAQSIAIRLDVDGVTVATGTANGNRPDLVPVFGSGNHGFSFNLPTNLTPGLHRIDVYTTDTTTNESHLLGSRIANTNQAAFGSLDSFNGTAFTGWAFDPNAGSDSIQIMYQLDGHAPNLITANVSRPDLTPVFGSPNHGFSVNIPALLAGNHTLTVWVVDSSTQALTFIGQRAFSTGNSGGNFLPMASLDVASTTQVAGWIHDDNLSGGASMVRIDIDGIAGTPFLANIARPDLAPIFGSPNFGFSQSLSLSPGQHRIDVYTFDEPGNTLTLIASRIVGAAAPLATIDTLTATRIAGWAHSDAYPTQSVTLRVEIDGQMAMTFAANDARPDLTPVFGSPNFGYDRTLPSLLSGNHTLRLYVIDPLTLSATLVSTRTFTVA